MDCQRLLEWLELLHSIEDPVDRQNFEAQMLAELYATGCPSEHEWPEDRATEGLSVGDEGLLSQPVGSTNDCSNSKVEAKPVPDYELWIEEGDRTLKPVHARNEDHAVAIYGNQLGLRLTLEDQDVPAYGMLRVTVQKQPHWAEQHIIPVWNQGPA